MLLRSLLSSTWRLVSVCAGPLAIIAVAVLLAGRPGGGNGVSDDGNASYTPQAAAQDRDARTATKASKKINTRPSAFASAPESE